MSGAPDLSPELALLVERWRRAVSTKRELIRVGITPKPGNRRGLLAMLMQQPPDQLEQLVEYCVYQQNLIDDTAQKAFWTNRIPIIDEALNDRANIQRREKRRRKKIRRKQADTLEREQQSENARMLDPMLGVKLSTDHDRNHLSGFIQGGAPGSKR